MRWLWLLKDEQIEKLLCMVDPTEIQSKGGKSKQCNKPFSDDTATKYSTFELERESLPTRVSILRQQIHVKIHNINLSSFSN